MRVVIQRVSEAKVTIGSNISGKVGLGFMILLGIEHDDTIDDIFWLVKKIVGLRVFNDEALKMNKSIKDVKGEVLLISQFTLYASTKKGNRPSFIKAAKPAQAKLLYEQFIEALEQKSIIVQTGEFGADMKVSLINDGPVTIIIDSKIKE